MHSQVDAWEADVLSNVEARAGNGRSRDEKFIGEVLTPAVTTSGARLKLAPEEVFFRAAGTFPGARFEDLANFVGHNSELFYAAGRFARSPAGKAADASLHPFAEFVNRYTEGRDPTEINAESVRITGLKKAKKTKELEAIAFGRSPNPFHRLLAAVYLVGLGDKTRALELLDKREPLGLYDMNTIRAELKTLLDAEPAGPRKTGLEACFARWDQHCKMNDCTPLSPR